MEIQKKSIVQEINNLYTKLNNYPYYLHSVLVHDGGSDSGHYYAFIYDYEKNGWLRYNDASVTIVDEEVVFRESFGTTK